MIESYLLTRQFWNGSIERAVRAFCWTLAATLGLPTGGEPVGVDLVHVGWQDALTFAAGAALLSLLGSVGAGNTLGPPGSASLVQDRP